MSDDLPTSRFRRLARLARVGASSASALALGRDPASVAAHAADVLADLRGLAAKVGQLGSYLDGVLGSDVPPGVREALQRLNDATRTSPWQAIEAVVREDLGSAADAVLAAMDPMPAASGSIAQVHRATMPDGTPVAVKVQHPGVARVIIDELGQTRALMAVVGAVIPGTRAIFDEVRGRLSDELDQRHEAAMTRAFAEAMADVPDIVVPSVVDAWTGARVLTTVWCDGIDLDTAAREPDLTLRSRWANALVSTLTAGIGRGLVHADPNAGNFRFRADGSVAVLDLGCVQPLPPEGVLQLGTALGEADAEALVDVLAPSEGGARDDARPLMAAMLGPFLVHNVVDTSTLHAIALATRTYKAGMAKHRSSAGPPWAPLVLRSWLGLLAHAAHLKAPVDGVRIRRLATEGSR